MKLRPNPINIDQARAAGWTVVVRAGDHLGNLNWQMCRWIEQHCGDYLESRRNELRGIGAILISTFAFRSEQDATLFALRWPG